MSENIEEVVEETTENTTEQSQEEQRVPYQGLTKEAISQLSDEELQETLEAKNAETETYGKEIQERLYGVTLGSKKNYNKIMKVFEKGVKWNHRSSFSIVGSYEALKTFKANLSDDAYIECKGHVLNAIYSTILQNEGQGYFDAKSHITLIVDINDSISSAMQQVKLDNEDLQARHVELSMLDDESNQRKAAAEQGIEREKSVEKTTDESADRNPTNAEIMAQIQNLMSQLNLG